MAAALDGFRYIGYLQSRWRAIGASCLLATALAGGISALLPREYTATARIVIEPPAGTDLRAAVAVSPIYLESLKTYEQFAASDSLFRTAVDRFGLRALLGNRPVETLKKRVLQTGLLRNTRILEISATLPDAHKAQALAQFIAEATADLSRSLLRDADPDLLRAMEQQREELQARLRAAEAAWLDLAAREPVGELEAESENAALLRSSLQEQLTNTGLEIADEQQRLGTAAGGEAAEIRREQASAVARREQLRNQLDSLARQAAERDRLLSLRTAHRQRADSERKAAQAQLTAVETQLREARGGAAYRGERLRIIDPGIVPERPSSPNLPLNVAAAFLLGLCLPLLWFTLELSCRDAREIRRFARTLDD